MFGPTRKSSFITLRDSKLSSNGRVVDVEEDEEVEPKENLARLSQYCGSGIEKKCLEEEGFFRKFIILDSRKPQK